MPLTGKAREALEMAVQRMHGRLDRGGEPMVTHSLRVGMTFDNEALQTIGFLHDLIEDTDTRVEEVHDRFGYNVALAVSLLTRKDGETYLQYIDRIKWNLFARQVKIADLKDNLAPSRLGRLPLKEQKSLALRWQRALAKLESL